jgi:hypothetical protein
VLGCLALLCWLVIFSADLLCSVCPELAALCSSHMPSIYYLKMFIAWPTDHICRPAHPPQASLGEANTCVWVCL